MKTNLNRLAARAGYTLIEVAVASTILLIGVGSACVLSLTMSKQEESHTRVARAFNRLENAVHLYHLGFDTAGTGHTVFSLMPPDPMEVASGFTATTESVVAMPGIGNPEMVQFSIDFYTTSDATDWSAGTWGGRPDDSVSTYEDSRTVGPVKAFRHSFRH